MHKALVWCAIPSVSPLLPLLSWGCSLPTRGMTHSQWPQLSLAPLVRKLQPHTLPHHLWRGHQQWCWLIWDFAPLQPLLLPSQQAMLCPDQTTIAVLTRWVGSVCRGLYAAWISPKGPTALNGPDQPHLTPPYPWDGSPI